MFDRMSTYQQIPPQQQQPQAVYGSFQPAQGDQQHQQPVFVPAYAQGHQPNSYVGHQVVAPPPEYHDQRANAVCKKCGTIYQLPVSADSWRCKNWYVVCVAALVFYSFYLCLLHHPFSCCSWFLTILLTPPLGHYSFLHNPCSRQFNSLKSNECCTIL